MRLGSKIQIYQLSQLIFENFDRAAEVYRCMGYLKGDEAADTDLISMFCWPNTLAIFYCTSLQTMISSCADIHDKASLSIVAICQ